MATESILFDTMVVSWGIRADANLEQRQLVHWTHKFIEQCQRDRVRIFIPAPVVAESLLPVPIEQHELVIETYARHFRVLPFDLAAAREFARIWAKREPKIREDDLRGGSAPKK